MIKKTTQKLSGYVTDLAAAAGVYDNKYFTIFLN